MRPLDDGAQRAVAAVRGAPAPAEQVEPVAQALGQRGQPERGGAGGAELDGQRQPVQAAAQLGDERHAAVGRRRRRARAAGRRARNSRTDGLVGSAPTGTGSGGSARTASWSRASRSRLVTSRTSSGAAATSRSASSATGSRTCSALSSTSSPCDGASAAHSAPTGSRPGTISTPAGRRDRLGHPWRRHRDQVDPPGRAALRDGGVRQFEREAGLARPHPDR